MMKYLFFLMLCSQVCFSQKSIFDTIYLNPNFRQVNLTEPQKELIASHYRGSKPKTRSSADSIVNAYNRINLYTYFLLDNDQKSAYEKAWNQLTENRIRAEFSYLNLSDQQVQRILYTMQNFSGADTLKIIKHYPDIPKDSLLFMLDSNQIALEKEHQEEKIRNREKYIIESDLEKARDTAFERKRLQLVTKYYSQHLQKAKRKAVQLISRINYEDAQRVQQLTNIYQSRVIADMKLAGGRCYSRDSILIAPINQKLIAIKYYRYSLLPNLCVYWCRFGTDDTPEANAEETHIINELEYLKKTYDEKLSNILRNLQQHKTKLLEKIDFARPPKQKGTVVNIVAEGRIQAVEKIAELLLAK